MSLPAWLSDALDAAGRRGPAPEEDSPRRPGDVRVVQPLDGPDHGGQRLVLVLEIDEARGYAQVALTSPELDLAGDRDVRLDGRFDDLPYPLLVELDMLGPVLVVQLGARIGGVQPSMARTLREAPLTELAGINSELVGVPVIRRSDPRWEFKTAELSVLEQLSREAMAELIDGTVTVPEPAIWRELIRSANPRDAKSALTGLLAHAPLAAPSARLAADLSRGCEGLSTRLGPDAARVLRRHLMRGLCSHPPAPPETLADLTAAGAPEALAAELGTLAIRGHRAATALLGHASSGLPRHARVRGPHGYIQITTFRLEEQ